MGINRRIKIGGFLFLLILSFTLSAQNQRRIHVVKAGETLYGISRQYDLKPEDLRRFNPEVAEEGLKIGTKLLIPDEKSLNLALQKEVESQRDSSKYFYHEVQKGETLYSLSKQYDRSIAAIKKANPALQVEGLKEGMTLRIPKLKEEQQTEKPEAKKDSLEAVEQVNSDEDWLYHKVAPKQTAYSLAQRYKISLDSLYLLNPAAENGLRIGQWLKLPLNRKPEEKERPKEKEQVKEVAVAAQDTPTVAGTAGESDYFLYKIKAGDTFFNLKKRYQVSEEELIHLNPEIKNGLVQGRYIIMPKKKESKELSWLEKLLRDKEAEEKREPVTADTQAEKEALNEAKDSVEEKTVEGPDSLAVDSTKHYRIAVVLPFRANLYSDTLDYRNLSTHRDSEMALQFYLGLKSAADSLAGQGMNLSLRVYDTEGSTSRIRAIANDILESEIDLVFGPAYSKNVELLSQELTEIPIVSPLSRSVEVKGKPNLIQMVPTDEVRNQRIADLINRHYPESRVFLAHCGSEEEKAQAQAIKGFLNPREQGFVNKIVDCAELQNSRNFSLGAADSLAKVVVLLSNQPVFSADLVSKLYSLKDSNIVLVASPRLLNMPTMELQYLDALNFATYEVRNTDYQDSLTQKLVRKFRMQYEADAGPFALQGFDVGYYFFKGLWGYDQQLLERLEFSLGCSTGFKFEKHPEGGLENQYLFLSQLADFQLRRLKSD